MKAISRISLILSLLLPRLAAADGASHPEVAAGNEALAAGDAAKALSHYQAAKPDLPNNPDLAFNEGGALYAQKQYADAAKAFLAAASSPDPTRRAEALRHYGDAQLRQGDASGAAQAYEQALSINPNDEIARHNLEVALAAKEQQQQQQQQQDDQQQPQSQPQQGEQQNQQGDQQDQQQQQQQQQQGQQQDQQGQQQDQQQQQEQQQQQGQSGEPKEQGEQQQQAQQGEEGKEQGKEQKLLDSLKAKEKSFLHERRRRGATAPRTVEKDW